MIYADPMNGRFEHYKACQQVYLRQEGLEHPNDRPWRIAWYIDMLG